MLSKSGVCLPDGQKIEGLVSAISLRPVFGSHSYLHLDGSNLLTIRGVSTHSVLARLDSPLVRSLAFGFGVKFIASAYTQRIVEVNNRTALVLKMPTLAEEVVTNTSAVPGGLAVPGDTFSRPLDLPNPEQVKVEDAPPGVQWDAKARTLFWKVPSDTKSGIIEILLSYKREDGASDYQVEKVTVP